MDEPHSPRTPPPSTSHTEHGKSPSERTTCRREQCDKQKAREEACQSSQTTATPQLKVTSQKLQHQPNKGSLPATQTATIHVTSRTLVM
uniref:Uncharacterized protein n=1 Tax=Romanomermis culicivorax TaxID=13658 RepID=A0A915KTL5_ROMCU